MPPISLSKAKAKELIKEVDYERLAAYFLIVADEVKIDKAMHSKAAKELGLTEGSAPQIYNRLLKKLREGDCYFDEGEEGGQDTTTITAPNTATKKAAPKKRKGDGDPSGSPAPKKAGRGKKDVEKGTPEATKEDAIKNEEVF